MLRLTPALTLLAFPIALTRLLCYHKRERPPPSVLSPLPEAIILSAFPIAWFYAFLYYTEVPSVLFVVLTVVAAGQHNHWLAALVCFTNFHSGGSSNLTIESWVS
jgi:alpha-1,2-glucosyltransferase